MAHPSYLREKAIRLRVDRGLTLTEIAERLALGKTTVWYWIKDVPVSPDPRLVDTPRKAAARKRAVKSVTRKYRLLREDAYAEGRREFPALASDPTFRDFVCMYIGEGYRRNRNCVSLGNSNPSVVKLANAWITCFARNPVTYGFQYHEDQNPVDLQRFWGCELGVDPEHIVARRKSNSGRLSGRNWRSRWGVLTVRTGDTLLRARLEGWMDCVQERWLDSPGVGA